MKAMLKGLAAAAFSSVAIVAIAAPPVVYVEEPIAAAAIAEGPGAETVNAIVQALNADASLKGSKITVQADGEVAILTGVAPTKELRDRASEIASAGGATIVNAMQAERTVYATPDYDLRG